MRKNEHLKWLPTPNPNFFSPLSPPFFWCMFSASQGACLIWCLVTYFLNTSAPGRWLSVYSSCRAEQMDTGWHLRITPRNNDLSEVLAQLFWCDHKLLSMFGAPVLVLCPTNCCSFIHRTTEPCQASNLSQCSTAPFCVEGETNSILFFFSFFLFK